jgi:low affinity Fe/Cu permease
LAVRTPSSRSLWIVAVAGCLSAAIAIGAAVEGPFVSHGVLGQVSSVPQPTQSVKPPLPGGQVIHTPKPLQSASFSTSWLVAILVAVAVVIIGLLLWKLIQNRVVRMQRQAQLDDATLLDEAIGGGDGPNAETIRRGLDAAAERLDEPRIPRDAIILAWLGLQEAAEDSGVVRRGPETPTEFTTRVFTTLRADGTPVDVAAAHELLNLYLRARFDSHPTTAEDVAQARTALARLSESWPQPTLLAAQSSVSTPRHRE